MRTTVTVEEDIYKAVTNIASASGESFGKVISRLARKGLYAEAQDVPACGSRFPVFDVPADEPVITSEHVESLQAEELL